MEALWGAFVLAASDAEHDAWNQRQRLVQIPGAEGCLMSATLADSLVAFVALVQLTIALVELLLWNRPVVHRRLAFTADEARKVAPIVVNAGLYNGFLAAGLLWGLLTTGDDTAIKLFFLACVVVAGVFGAVTLKWTTLVLQAIPGGLALFAVWMSRIAP